MNLSLAEKRLRELVASPAPVRERLSALVRLVEELTPSGMIASVLLLDRDRLRLGAGPSLPDAYNAAIEGLAIGPAAGSCGTAAFQDRTVSVYDIESDPLWADYRHHALPHGLRACWSTPIHGADGRVLGTFANYYRSVRDPSPVDIALTDMITRAAAEIIESGRGAAERPGEAAPRP